MSKNDRLERYEWLRSQQAWHASRGGAWHQKQERHYRRSANRLLDFPAMLKIAICNNRARMRKIVMKSNPLYKKLASSIGMEKLGCNRGTLDSAVGNWFKNHSEEAKSYIYNNNIILEKIRRI